MLESVFSGAGLQDRASVIEGCNRTDVKIIQSYARRPADFPHLQSTLRASIDAKLMIDFYTCFTLKLFSCSSVFRKT